ncbi:MAG: N-acetylglutaminylglutamine synthetase [Planctomycetes bacterium]|nr:N-acetylglutaminylglutamine synthetase [Planctomycetota bacterium]
MPRRASTGLRLDRLAGPTQRHWEDAPAPDHARMRANVALPMGWGRLLFAHTYDSAESLAAALCDEEPHQRDIALYVRDPHVVLSLAPQRLFLDPSHTYRLWSNNYRPTQRQTHGMIIRRLRSRRDVEQVNRIYASRGMVKLDPDWVMRDDANRRLYLHLVAEQPVDGQIIGAVSAVDHVEAFDDPENGASLWCLAVDAQVFAPGIGESLVRHVIEHFLARERTYIDLSVMHDNRLAIRLYEKLGFVRMPAFCVKHKNPINEPLFIAPAPPEQLNPYAKIIVDEARRRGIVVEVEDAEVGYFHLHFGGRSVRCRESLSELTTAVAMSRCDDKRVTRRVLERAKLRVPAQCTAGERDTHETFLSQHQRLVVKPARGEQGAGIRVDLSDMGEIEDAITAAKSVCDEVLLEQFVEGEDLRVVVIGEKVVAAAVRRPAQIVGTGKHTVGQLIEMYNRRRAAATDGESRVPIDDETRRCIKTAGRDMGDVLAVDETLIVRKTANLHTGGTIHDVTADLHPDLAAASIEAARALAIPVVGLDLLVKSPSESEYVIIEANERPGLANHEPQPTAERFIDLLFPNSAIAS